MNTKRRTFLPAFAGVMLLAFDATLLAQTANMSLSRDSVCEMRTAHTRVWQNRMVATNRLGIVTTNLHSYTEVATGLCYLSNGQYVDSVEQISAVADGAEAIQGQHKVHWAANANTPGGAVRLLTPGGKQLLSTVYGLMYYDTASGSNVLLAPLQDCTATIVGSNTLVYGNAFSNINADLRYTYRKGGFSQDVILKQRPPLPSAYGLAAATTRLQVITEFFNPPDPVQTVVTNQGMVEARKLSFGQMTMGKGRAFLFQRDGKTKGGASVIKHWWTQEGRTFLVEEIPYNSITSLLESLQSSTLKPDKSRVRKTVSLDRPKLRKLSFNKPNAPVKTVKSAPRETALVMDYDLGTTESDFTFQGDTTYYVSDLCTLSGTTVFEGGAVIKYSADANSEIDVESVDCESGPYRPIVFTSANDDSVGAAISGSTSNPWGNNASAMALYFTDGSGSLHNVRFSHLSACLSFQKRDEDVGGSLSMSDFQMVDCMQGVMSQDGSFYFGNGLACQVQYFFGDYNLVDDGKEGYGGQFLRAVNLTIHDCTSYADDQSSLMYFTNCLLVGVSKIYTEPYLIYTNSSVFVGESTNIFTTVGAGSHYLADDTYRNIGTADIDSSLLADLQSKTTYPPLTNSSLYITNDITLSPQALRDTDTPDLGYHYDPIDYAVNNAISNASVTITPNTVIASENYGVGLWTWSTSSINATGTPLQPIWITRYNTVQEQATTNWSYSVGQGGIWANSDDGSSTSLQFRFTDWAVMAGDLHYSANTTGGGVVSSANFQDCQFYGGNFTNLAQVLLVTNCLFERVHLSLRSGTSTAVSNTFYNNLFWQGSLNFRHTTNFDMTPWVFTDNLFDQTQILATNLSPGDLITRNAYTETSQGTLPPSTNDVNLGGPISYESGTLGDFYYPSNLTNLIHTGSRLASDAALYHYTITTNNAVEGTNIVSIGFHYVATDANGIPLDTDGDGLPDYIEDANGNGIVDGTETSWTNYNSTNGLAAPSGLVVFTPLQ